MVKGFFLTKASYVVKLVLFMEQTAVGPQTQNIILCLTACVVHDFKIIAIIICCGSRAKVRFLRCAN